jgi:hypothetical protein
MEARQRSLTSVLTILRSGPADGRMGAMEVLASRILLHPSEPQRSQRFYRDMLGLAIYREFGSPNALPWCSSWATAFSKSADARPIRQETRWRSGSKSVTYMASTGGCFTPGYRYSARRGKRPGAWWRCGSLIQTECESS